MELFYIGPADFFLAPKKTRSFYESPIMPYRRRKFSGKRKRTTRRSTAVTYSGLKRFMKRNTELKYHTREASANDVPDTGYTRDLSIIPQGDSSSDRDGNVVTLKTLVVRARLNNADSTGNMIRIIVARYYHEGSSAGPVDFPQASTAVLNPLASWSSVSKRGIMKVLHDRVYRTDPDDPNRFVKIVCRINSKIWFLDETLNPGQRGAIVLYACSDSSATAHPTISFVSQLSYTDA
jgi:hypothetical protein